MKYPFIWLKTYIFDHHIFGQKPYAEASTSFGRLSPKRSFLNMSKQPNVLRKTKCSTNVQTRLILWQRPNRYSIMQTSPIDAPSPPFRPPNPYHLKSSSIYQILLLGILRKSYCSALEKKMMNLSIKINDKFIISLKLFSEYLVIGLLSLPHSWFRLVHSIVKIFFP